jgi:hypothetical protein
MAQTMYTHVSKCKKNQILKNKFNKGCKLLLQGELVIHGSHTKGRMLTRGIGK